MQFDARREKNDLIETSETENNAENLIKNHLKYCPFALSS